MEEPAQTAASAEQHDLNQLEKMYLEDIDKVEELELPAEEAAGPPESEEEPSTIERFIQEVLPPEEPAPPFEHEEPPPLEGKAGPGQDVELPAEWRLPGETAAPAPRAEPPEASGFILREAPVPPEPPEPPEKPAAQLEPPEIPEEDVVFPEELVEDIPPRPQGEEAEEPVEYGPTTIEGFIEGPKKSEPPPSEAAPPAPSPPEQAVSQAPPAQETPSWMEPTQVPYPPRPAGENPPVPPKEPPPPSRWK